MPKEIFNAPMRRSRRFWERAINQTKRIFPNMNKNSSRCIYCNHRLDEHTLTTKPAWITWCDEANEKHEITEHGRYQTIYAIKCNTCKMQIGSEQVICYLRSTMNGEQVHITKSEMP